MTAARQMLPPDLPTPEEIQLARTSSRQIAALLGQGDTARLRVHNGEETIDVPVSALRLLADILVFMGEGKAVNIMPSNAALTTQTAADFLNVSRPYLVGLLEKGEIPFHTAGTHRRVYFQDALAYKEQRDAESHQALEELAAQAQELGMGY
ncbi:helix-turn-helix domain-containing protein [Rhodanobacter denitrificans]|uniref:Helix-turn-helix domain-containing protein n=1 Tax=Rhodanobacter denitrificans TaxID=666685 RepID=A0A368KIP4_9GAMM|nr:helix-turn-helix domain-containing protein [Rhodanobacter denitrificans]RCS31717.1 helix-turn-helix domain-containing protein [Rhodanobacter denitrificans]